MIVFLFADWFMFLNYFDTSYDGYVESDYDKTYGSSVHMAVFSFLLLEYELFRWFFRVRDNFVEWSDYRAEWKAKLKQDDPAELNDDSSEMPSL